MSKKPIAGKVKDIQIQECLAAYRLQGLQKETKQLEDQLSSLQESILKLKQAAELNYSFFQRNNRKISTLNKQVAKRPLVQEELDSLVQRMREVQEDHKEAVSYYLASPAELPNDSVLEKILVVLKAQIQIYQDQLLEKQRTYEALNSRYYSQYTTLNGEIEGLSTEIRKLLNERKQDLQWISSLDRKKAILEIGVNLQSMSLAGTFKEGAEKDPQRNSIRSMALKINRQLRNSLR